MRAGSSGGVGLRFGGQRWSLDRPGQAVCGSAGLTHSAGAHPQPPAAGPTSCRRCTPQVQFAARGERGVRQAGHPAEPARGGLLDGRRCARCGACLHISCSKPGLCTSTARMAAVLSSASRSIGSHCSRPAWPSPSFGALLVRPHSKATFKTSHPDLLLAPSALQLAEMKALIGYFDLDPNRCFRCVCNWLGARGCPAFQPGGQLLVLCRACFPSCPASGCPSPSSRSAANRLSMPLHLPNHLPTAAWCLTPSASSPTTTPSCASCLPSGVRRRGAGSQWLAGGPCTAAARSVHLPRRSLFRLALPA